MQSPSAVILETPKIKSDIVSTVSPSIIKFLFHIGSLIIYIQAANSYLQNCMYNMTTYHHTNQIQATISIHLDHYNHFPASVLSSPIPDPTNLLSTGQLEGSFKGPRSPHASAQTPSMASELRVKPYFVFNTLCECTYQLHPHSSSRSLRSSHTHPSSGQHALSTSRAFAFTLLSSWYALLTVTPSFSLTSQMPM